ncbi:hypothetical protein LCGC14_0231220 [marine sediment metagenome]|uniref:Uncharacterized protein n=1 Tax=marine sediment metagenome TaxID=412755 RepID=A0A0F9U9Z2_9ZZZZ
MNIGAQNIQFNLVQRKLFVLTFGGRIMTLAPINVMRPPGGPTQPHRRTKDRSGSAAIPSIAKVAVNRRGMDTTQGPNGRLHKPQTGRHRTLPFRCNQSLHPQGRPDYATDPTKATLNDIVYLNDSIQDLGIDGLK